MTGFSAAEAEFLFNASFVFFWSKLRDFDGINDHSVRVMGFGIQGVGEGMVGLVGGLHVSFGNVVRSLPLSLEGDGFLVPFLDGGGDGIHRHDVVHQGWWNSCREVSNQDVGIGDVGEGYVVFESGNILHQGGEVDVVLHILSHALGRQPGNGVSGDIVVLEHRVELSDKVSKSSKSKRSSRDGALAEGRCPGEGRSSGHVQEGESNLFVDVVIDCFVNKKVELHGVQPMLGFFVRSIKRFGDANV